MADKALHEMSERFEVMYANTMSAVDPTGAVAAGANDTDAVLGAERTAADGGDRLHHVVWG
jgi:hypothetical protein